MTSERSIETALQWLQRAKQNQLFTNDPQDPNGGAWSFLRGYTGIRSIDSVWSRQIDGKTPVISLDGSVGKTWLLASLAARYVVATRLSRFEPESSASTSTSTSTSKPTSTPTPTPQEGLNLNQTQKGQLPIVFFLDSTYDITALKLARLVKSTLLRQNIQCDARFQSEFIDCLSRIHIVRSDSISNWVCTLETILGEISTRRAHNCPSLLLWDGFLAEEGSDSSKSEIVRQVSRILQDGTTGFIFSKPPYSGHQWFEKLHPQNIQLERFSGPHCNSSTKSTNGETTGNSIPFSLSLSGVLS